MPKHGTDVYLNGTNGTPFTSLGDVLVDPVQYNSGTVPDSLFGLGALDPDVHAITGRITDATAGVWKTVDVTETVQDLIDLGRTYAQFRLQHQLFGVFGARQPTNRVGAGALIRAIGRRWRSSISDR